VTKAIQKILSLIPHSNRDPFFVLESTGKILFTNKQGYKLFNISETQGSILDYFALDSKEKFNELLDKAVELNDTLSLEHFEFDLNTGKKINSQLILNAFESSSKLFLLCTIIPKKYDISFLTESRIKVADINTQSIINDDKLNEIISKIEALYPITFIGKEIIHKLIDELEDIFWINDSKGNFLIVNDYFAKSLGLKPFQMEGKQADEFIPGYLKEFSSLIDKFVKDTLNCVVTEGVQFREIENLKNKEIVQLPLFDEENNILAIIGFSQPSAANRVKEKEGELFDALYKIIDYFPKSVAFITSQGTIKHSSEEFCKLFQRKSEDLNGLNFADILPGTLAESVNRFFESSDKQRILPLNRYIEIEKHNEPDYTVYLTKFFGSNDQPEGFSILIEKIEYAENLQHLIKSRGRMFEFLIQNNPEPIYIYDKENLKFLEVNKAALELYGYSKDEFLQMDLTDLYNPEDIQTLLGSSSEQEIEGKFSRPFRHKRKDGSSVFVELSKISFQFNDKDAHFNIVRDVTQTLELEKKNQLFKAAFDNTVDMIFVTDADGIINYVNSATVNILGIPKLDLENSSMASLANDEDRSTINTSIFQSHLKESVSLFVGLKTSEGNFIEAEITATPVVDFEDNIESFVIIGKVEKPSDTKVEVKEVIKEVIVERPETSSVQETKQLESVFLSGVFHEILTPMNVILGFAQELTEGIDNLTSDQKEAVEIINQNRGKLLSTMNAIIEFSEIQKKKDEWNITNLNITEVVEEIDKDIYEITGSRDINFAYGKISSSLQFETDKQKFDCLINNLIRLISRIIKENKIYFSAFQVNDNSFMLIISDGYASTSDYLADILRKIFIDKKDPKEIGVSKLGTQITQSLLELLQVKFVTSVDDTGKNESGFLFPIKFSPAVEEQVEKQIDEIVQEEEQQITDVVDEKVFSPEVPAPEDDQGIVIEEETVIPETGELTGQEDIVESVNEVEQVQEEFETPTEPMQEQIEETQQQAEQVQEEFEAPEANVEPEQSRITQEEINIPESISQPEEFQHPEPEVHQIENLQDGSEVENETELTIEEPGKKQFQEPGDKLDISHLNCLYIEDQVDSQILFKVQMKGLNDIKYAVSFEEALPLLDTEQFDFIVMDINLQGEYNGLDALKIIHKMPGYEDIPIIAVTAYVLPGDKEKFIATGFNDFISKPIFREKMIESLEKIFLQKA
jgi:PAS domain S-box-containing protein